MYFYQEKFARMEAEMNIVSEESRDLATSLRDKEANLLHLTASLSLKEKELKDKVGRRRRMRRWTGMVWSISTQSTSGIRECFMAYVLVIWAIYRLVCFFIDD